jgi:hypothetical protein
VIVRRSHDHPQEAVSNPMLHCTLPVPTKGDWQLVQRCDNVTLRIGERRKVL